MNTSASDVPNGLVTWHLAGALPLVIATIAMIVVVVLWLYPSQLRFIARPWRWLLPALRIIALSTLALSLLKPAIIRARAAAQPDALVVLVDRSRSMSVADASRTPAQLVALADALGMLPAGVERRDGAAGLDSDLETLRQCVDEVHARRSDVDMASLQTQRLEYTRRELDASILQYKSALESVALQSHLFASESVLAGAIKELSNLSFDLPADAWRGRADACIVQAETALADLRAVADQELYSGNDAVKRVCDALVARSRIDLAMQGLTRSEVQKALDRHGPVYVFGFGGAGEVQSLAWPMTTAAPIADAAATDIDAALRSAAGVLRGDRGVRAYVVLSDGRAADVPLPPPRASGASSVDAAPVYAVNVAPRLPQVDVSLDRVTMPVSLFVGENMTVRAMVRHRGLSGQTVDVRLSSGSPQSRDDATEQQQQQRIVLSESQSVAVEFTLKADSTPAQRIEIRIDPIAGEATTENNSIVRIVKVATEKVNVALWSGSPAWDFQYLRNALARASWIALDEAIMPGQATKLATTPQQILEKDVIILHDLAAGSLDGEQWQAISQFVTARGQSMILVAGDAHLPAEYGQNELLASLLPYHGGLKPVWRIWPGPTPSFGLIPAPGTESLDALRLSDDAVEGRQRWNVLPGWYRYLSIAQLKGNSTPLLIERDSGAPVLIESRLGLGRVLFFGGNETWRWRYKTGQTLQDRFWLGLVRYTAGAAYAASNGRGVLLDLDALTVKPGLGVRARARVRDADFKPSQDTQQTLRVIRAGQELYRQNMPLAGGVSPPPGRYETMLAMPEIEGDYQVELLAEPPVILDVRVGRNCEMEMNDVSADESALRRLARQSGGEYLPIERIGELDSLLQSRPSARAFMVEYPLWDSPYLFLFVVACLGTEWALCKAMGLA